MFVVGNLISSFAQIIDIILNVLSWCIILRALVSWVNPDPSNPIVNFLQSVTEPVLAPVRRLLPFTWKIGLDLSPILALLLITFLRGFLVKTLMDLALRLS